MTFSFLRNCGFRACVITAGNCFFHVYDVKPKEENSNRQQGFVFFRFTKATRFFLDREEKHV